MPTPAPEVFKKAAKIVEPDFFFLKSATTFHKGSKFHYQWLIYENKHAPAYNSHIFTWDAEDNLEFDTGSNFRMLCIMMHRENNGALSRARRYIPRVAIQDAIKLGIITDLLDSICTDMSQKLDNSPAMKIKSENFEETPKSVETFPVHYGMF